MKEHAFVFGANQPLVGVITEPPREAWPAGGAPEIGVVFLNAGVIHRVGPSRLYVHLARALAPLGWVSARFDHSGVGDSPVRRDGLPFEESSLAEARDAMDWLAESRGLRHFVLVGLCSGAVTAFETAGIDRRVSGVVMINPQGFDQNVEWNRFVLERSQARRYWTQSLFSAESWRKALTGRVGYRRLASVVWGQVRSRRVEAEAVTEVRSRVAASLEALINRGVRALLVCSEGDDGIDYMNVIVGRDVRKMSSTGGMRVEILRGADHSLTLTASQSLVVDAVCRWAASVLPDLVRDRESPHAAGQPAAADNHSAPTPDSFGIAVIES